MHTVLSSLTKAHEKHVPDPVLNSRTGLLSAATGLAPATSHRVHVAKAAADRSMVESALKSTSKTLPTCSNSATVLPDEISHTRTILSSEAVAILSPSCEKQHALTACWCPLSSLTSLPCAPSFLHTCTVPSWQHVAMRSPSRCTATPRTCAECPAYVMMHDALGSSHTLAVPSLEHDTSSFRPASDEEVMNLTSLTAPVCPSSAVTLSPVSASQICTVPPSLPVAMRAPSNEMWLVRIVVCEPSSVA
mmetsp:Transcript_20605/g.51576  ORF Transcript_20605/g.51576 Transcript_20605/m.51576 type:complete len:248 (-) Transcript_20605:2541-3284(-)